MEFCFSALIDAEWQRDGEREEQSLDAELRRDREALADDLGHRTLSTDAGAEVELQDVAHVLDVLLVHGLIESVVAVPALDRFRRAGLSGFLSNG